ncbi:uncharacterized protein LOC119833340 [Zerene cesonia]|uniref:uncharacterized protein LOC119833340 n=1 Tax=Zerene cesonia TaxID=33412 RepID=UPI0018E52B8F|nr:uncharacterized protein LOC119833340 [Zerene cesonia]
MRSLLILTFLCAYLKQLECLSSTEDVFEFGTNEGRVAFSTSGNIGLLEKNVKIPIKVPYCMDLTYVRVVVDNWKAPPKVDFDSEINTINIKYRLLQFSKSSYTVIAKGVLNYLKFHLIRFSVSGAMKLEKIGELKK